MKLNRAARNSGKGGGRRRDGERGFALLLVFAMAAMVAITLYMQLPRVAFEAQRDRETMLIQRGEQYQRAIELYVRKNNRYPARLEDLERDQDVRYLRRRYKDPMTGKDEWRVIHVNAAGQLEDSLVKKPTTGGNPETASTAATATELTGDENVAENTAMARQRAGDQTAASAQFPGGGGDRAGAVGTGQPSGVPPVDDGLVPLLDEAGNVVQRTRTEAEAQAQQAGLAPPGIPGDPNAPADPNNPGAAPGAAPQVRLGPGGIPIIENPSAVVASNGNPQGVNPAGGPPGQGANPVVAGANGGGGGAAGGQQSAQQLLQGLLTREVPGGLAGIQQRRGIQPSATGGRGMGAGIAGVASKYEMRGILVYDEQESIHKWEFVYDAQKAAGNAAGNPAQNGARGAQGQFGTPSLPGSFGGGQSPSGGPPRGSGGASRGVGPNGGSGGFGSGGIPSRPSPGGQPGPRRP
ncbi:MAG: hypothetical protein U5J83_07040 [Bryobacterales bacterium]|nr:hypothetical protein [Bryobacterales bacterium]